MVSFLDFVTDESIIECVCRKRASEAAKRHVAHHDHALTSDSKIKTPSHLVYQLTPPRRQWIQLGDKGRRVISSCGLKQTIATEERTYRSVLWTIKRDIKHNVDAPYLYRLKSFIQGVKDRIQDESYSINSPITIPVFKKKKEGYDEYRPICIFENLFDAIIIILANRYLSRLFDRFFYEDSLAFRPKRMFHGQMMTTFHHEAVGLMEDYLKRTAGRKVYVAECDMQKFYDTVDHNVVRNEFDRLLSFAQDNNPNISFKEISHIFYSYLDCYTFTDNVWNKNKDSVFWRQHHIDNGAFGWVKEYQNKADSPRAKKPIVGVPQGGALSGLIANIVINHVDSCITPKLKKNNDLYVRFCDDMILLSTNKKRCKSLSHLYIKKIKTVKLVPHCSSSMKYGTPEQWTAKTKKVYQWTSDDIEVGSRWIGFVGYEINRTGEIRIRRSSIKKEKRKQRKVINELFSLTYKKHRVNDSSMESSYRSTLTSMAVGRVTLWNYETLRNEYCWINGFRMLNDNPFVRTQIRDLDRCRNRVIHRANECLNRLKSWPGGIIAKEGNNKDGGRFSPIMYYGKPFSYYYHFKKNLLHKEKE